MESAPKVAAVVHITEKTEEDEQLAFAINLIEGEEDKWEEKIERFCLIAERRRAHNYKRMNDLIEEKKRAAQLAKKS